MSERISGLCCECGRPAHVIDSRGARRGEVRRRRHCRYCGIRFTTYEIRESDYQALRETAASVARLADALEAIR